MQVQIHLSTRYIHPVPGMVTQCDHFGEVIEPLRSKKPTRSPCPTPTRPHRAHRTREWFSENQKISHSLTSSPIPKPAPTPQSNPSKHQAMQGLQEASPLSASLPSGGLFCRALGPDRHIAVSITSVGFLSVLCSLAGSIQHPRAVVYIPKRSK